MLPEPFESHLATPVLTVELVLHFVTAGMGYSILWHIYHLPCVRLLSAGLPADPGKPGFRLIKLCAQVSRPAVTPVAPRLVRALSI